MPQNHKLPKAITPKDQINACKYLKKQLLLIAQDPYEGQELEHFDLISWLNSKIQNRPFAEVVKEKALKCI